MGTSKQGIELLSPKAQEAYYKVKGEKAPSAGRIGDKTDQAQPEPTEPSGLSHLSNEELLAIARSKK